jgi:5-formyltetrahydrofolate cyclo-ligase
MSPGNDAGPDPAAEKKAWRLAIGGLFKLIPPETRAGLDAALAARLGEWLAGRRLKSVLAFAPLPDEPDLFPFFRRWLAEGGILGLPVWPRGGPMFFRRVRDLDRDLAAGRGGVREPIPGLPEMPPEAAEAALAPGRAFAAGTLARLGRGAGCYDALFRRGGLMKAGVAYDFQIFPHIPAGEGDVPVDLILTPSRIVRRD